MDVMTMETEGMAPMLAPDQIAKLEREDAKRRTKMSPRGALGLPPLLDQRRLEWGITDSAFRVQAAYDRILVFQLLEVQFEKGTYGDSPIVIPESHKAAKKRAAPRGIIVSAGLKALDNLRSNGMELGHIVMFCQVSPFKVDTDVGDQLLILRDGDIIGSEDTAKMLREGTLKRHRAKVSRTYPAELNDCQENMFRHAHVYQEPGKPVSEPQEPWMGEDY